MSSKSQTCRAVLALATLALLVASGAGYCIPKIGADEIALGKTSVKDAEKDIKLIDDPALCARVQRIGDALANVANTRQTPSSYGSACITPFTYTFKVVDDDDVNAFSLPGGHIYVYKGAIKLCETDHELAAVIAHEIAHAAHHHMVYLLKEQSKLDGRCAMVLLASMLGRVKSHDMSNVMMGAQFYKLSKVNGQGQQAELDADRSGIIYMAQAGYNPVGMLTFLEGLAKHPDMIDWGILQTHPQSSDRARAVKEQLVELGIKINRRDVAPSLGARVIQSTEGSSPVYGVAVGDVTVCKLASRTEAEQSADRINQLLDTEVQIREITTDGSSIIARGQILLCVSDQDAAISGKPASQVASEAADTVRKVLFKKKVQDLW